MFILASASPRRRELLQQIDASFEVKVSSVEEVTGGNLAPAEIVVENAVRKAKAVAKAATTAAAAKKNAPAKSGCKSKRK